MYLDSNGQPLVYDPFNQNLNDTWDRPKRNGSIVLGRIPKKEKQYIRDYSDRTFYRKFKSNVKSFNKAYRKTPDGPVAFSVPTERDSQLVNNKRLTPDQELEQVLKVGNYSPQGNKNIAYRTQNESPVVGINFTRKENKDMAKKGYSMQDRLHYHSERAKKNSVNPKTGEAYSDVQRARSRGYLQATKNQATCYKLKNGLPLKKPKAA